MSSDLPPKPPSENEDFSPAADTSIPSQSSATGLTSNVAAGLAVVFSLPGGILFLLIEKKDRFVRFWAMQSVVIGVIYFAFQFFTYVVNVVFRGPLGFVSWIWNLFAWFVGIGFFILYVVMLVKSFTGKEWEIPVAGKVARQQLGQLRL